MQQHPRRIAVRWGDKTRTFAEIADLVARFAGALQRLGVQPGDRVAMLSLNSERYLKYPMAVPWAGAVLNPCNIRWSPAAILYSLEDSGSTVLMVDETFQAMVAQFRRKSTTLRKFIYCGNGETPEGMYGYEVLVEQIALVPDALCRGNDMAGIFYTWGAPTGFSRARCSATTTCAALAASNN